MNKVRLSISPEASNFIGRMMKFGTTGEENWVLTIAPQAEAFNVSVDQDVSAESLEDEVKRLAQLADQKSIKFRWVVGISRRERFPSGDIVMCDGIPCFIPKELGRILDGRAVVLTENQLQIIPPPPPP